VEPPGSAGASGRRRLGLLGGSFDPPHLGHLILADEAWWALGLDEVRFVPAAQAPHKPGGPALPAELRVRLVARAIEGHPGLTLSRVELERPGPSYTVDTVEAVAAAEPDADLWLIIGGDQLLGVPEWREPERILRLARLAVAVRSGQERRTFEAVAGGAAPGRIDWLEMPAIGISSTLVRERMAAGRPVRALVPAGVADLLAAEGLDRSGLNRPAKRE
jgi:nicotinate-nucleotide adenylyltransferase